MAVHACDAQVRLRPHKRDGLVYFRALAREFIRIQPKARNEILPDIDVHAERKAERFFRMRARKARHAAQLVEVIDIRRAAFEQMLVQPRPLDRAVIDDAARVVAKPACKPVFHIGHDLRRAAQLLHLRADAGRVVRLVGIGDVVFRINRAERFEQRAVIGGKRLLMENIHGRTEFARNAVCLPVRQLTVHVRPFSSARGIRSDAACPPRRNCFRRA